MKTKSPIDEHAIVEFTTGACGQLALALHDLTGWSIRVEHDPPPWTEDIAHVWVLNDEGNAVDVNGVHDGPWARTKYSETHPGEIRPMSRDDLAEGMSDSHMEWARELIAEHPEHFGLASTALPSAKGP